MIYVSFFVNFSCADLEFLFEGKWILNGLESLLTDEMKGRLTRDGKKSKRMKRSKTFAPPDQFEGK